ncbi:hypothetical protein AB4254_11990 [Vibrio breoganii]
MRTLLLYTLMAVITVSLMAGMFLLKRNFNYYFGYETRVENTVSKTVCSMIKPSMYTQVLQDPSMCIK